MLFTDLKIIEPILRALKNEGYTQPTPIQEKAIPILLERKDLLGCAQTGTGKTAAFAIPILQLLHEDELFQKGPAGILRMAVRQVRIAGETCGGLARLAQRGRISFGQKYRSAGKSLEHVR